MNIETLISNLQKAQSDGFKTVLFKNENYDELDFDIEKIDDATDGKILCMIFTQPE
jgi:hypothetical protein